MSLFLPFLYLHAASVANLEWGGSRGQSKERQREREYTHSAERTMTTAAKQGTVKGGRKGGRAERGIGEWDPKPGAKHVFFFQLHAGGGRRDGIR